MNEKRLRNRKDKFSFTGAGPEAVLEEVFGYKSFRPFQKEIITSVLAGHDTLAVMPTGGGKSLCYQIPALIFKGLTVVVTPLIALMQDQASSLAAAGISAVFLNSSLQWSDYMDSIDDIKGGNTKILYVSPEGLAAQRIQNLLHDQNIMISCFTVDEAHCISEWGHDFRPDYMEIASVRDQFPEAVCLALTATATDQVRKDIILNLHMKKESVFVASFNRPNIFLDVKRKSRNAVEQVVRYIEAHPDDSGIIYCFSRRNVDSLSEILKDRGYSVLSYHAGLPVAVRDRNQTAFIQNKIRIIVATVAFGMGIDKPNVRFVIHYDMPKSIEQYYQEIGRAGRDGLPAHALLLYNSRDCMKVRYFFDDSYDRKKAERLLQQMIDYATARTCRRKILLSYFGEKYDLGQPFSAGGLPDTEQPHKNNTPCCDICELGPLPKVDVTIPVQKLLSCIIRTGERFGGAYVIEVLLGSKQKRIIQNRHNKLSTWGIGTELGREDWFFLIDSLIDEGILLKEGDYNIIHITPKGRHLLSTRQVLFLPIQFNGEKFYDPAVTQENTASYSKKRSLKKITYHIDRQDREAVRIAAALKEWRQKRSEDDNVPPFVVLSDKTIADICTKHPESVIELRNIYGIGPQRMERYGTSILQIVNEER
ncbi:MAG: DNA helicase RecQ [Treponema sp.]|jgi:ATP-dependent DNA helicase RecQ|nr:DNA helicase RecQ [Treponema sp.]